MTVRLIATGGTIASLADPETGAVRPAVSAQDLVATVPGLGPVEVEEVAHVNGWNVTPATMLEVARRASTGGPAVVTHGTDTIEETAFFCDLTVESDVVFAARDAQRVPRCRRTARATCCARRRWRRRRPGSAPCWCSTTRSTPRAGRASRTPRASMRSPRPATARSGSSSPVRCGSRCRRRAASCSRCRKALPPVPVIQTYTGIEEHLIETVLDATGAAGLVLEGTGLGNVPGSAERGVAAAVERGLPVVTATRAPSGGTHAVYGGPGAW